MGEDEHKDEMILLQRRLEGHYTHMKNFIRTQAEPTIFYLPVKHTPETEQFLEETRAAIDEKIRSLKTHLQRPVEKVVSLAVQAPGDALGAQASEEPKDL